MFGSSASWDRSTTHLNFDLTVVRTHDLQIMTVHFMSMRPHLTLVYNAEDKSNLESIYNLCPVGLNIGFQDKKGSGKVKMH